VLFRIVPQFIIHRILYIPNTIESFKMGSRIYRYLIKFFIKALEIFTRDHGIHRHNQQANDFPS